MRVIKYIICSGLLFMLYACQGGEVITQNDNAKVFAYNDQEHGDVDSSELWQKSVAAKVDATFKLNFIEDGLQAEDLAKINSIANYLSTHENARLKLVGYLNTEGSTSYSSAALWTKMSDIASYFQQYGIDREVIDIISLGSKKLAEDYSGGKARENGTVEATLLLSI